MAYFKIIEASTTWTCPKSGDYKVICVSAGNSASVSGSASKGGSTSFGSLLTANAPEAVLCGLLASEAPMDGYSINNSNYGKVSAVVETIRIDACIEQETNTDLNRIIYRYPCVGTGVGYGAGGVGFQGKNNFGGLCGGMKMEIFSLKEGSEYAITIGQGVLGRQFNISTSTLSSGETKYTNYYCAAGSDGVVIIQEV